jgi:rhodanese-related sulfurtransferase
MAPELRRVLLETLVVVVLGLACALGANLISPRGLSLTRDYFPGTGKLNPPLTPPGQGNSNPVSGQGTGEQEAVIAHLKDRGLQPVDGKEALQLFRDPQYEQDLIVFVDARNDEHYREGHIPGAYQFDRYYPEKYLGVLPVCLNAAKVMVYCTGGHCEDSEFAALALKDAGVPPDRLFVFVGGMTEWSTNGSAIEIGERKSGNLRAAKR